MNKSQDFILKKLNEMHCLFNTIKIRYEYRDYLKTHLIEILPHDTFESNKEYILFEMEMESEFEKRFGDYEDVLFISSESLNEIHDVQFSLGHDIIERFEIASTFPHTFKESYFNILISQKDTSYALAA